MPPTRRTQPYRKGKTRPAGPTLASILAGKPAYGQHPSASRRRLRKRRANQK